VSEDVLKGELNEEFRKTVLDYRVRCEAKMRIEGKD
jgi:hypothetical protein